MATIKIKSGDQWTQIPMIGINPMPDAPSDGKTYGRKDGAWSEVNDGILVEDGGNGSVTIEIEPNVYYQFGECDSLTITLAEGTTGYLDEYMFEFSCPLFTATNFNDIEGIIWANNKKLIPKNNCKYQVSIRNNIASYIEIQSSVSILTYTTTEEIGNFRVIAHQEYAKKITLEDGTDVPITGTGALNYTFDEAGNHKVAIEFKEDVTSFSECFEFCSALTSIPENLFASNTAVTNFSGCFWGCSGLTSIPEKLFADNTAVTDFSNCFSYCTGLTSISANLFANNTAVTVFRECFSFCSGLTGSIPENLFANNTAVTTFRYCFSKCSGLTGSIPENLFTNNTAVTTFRGCFDCCSGLTSIPANLFANCPNATDFGYCFSECSGLTSIPANLFANCPNATDFSRCFSGCTSLTGSIPENLFATNTAVTDFSYCFSGCTSLTGNVPVDSDRTPIYNRSGNGKSGYEIVTSYSDCFQSCTGLTDYSSIPSDWK